MLCKTATKGRLWKATSNSALRSMDAVETRVCVSLPFIIPRTRIVSVQFSFTVGLEMLRRRREKKAQKEAAKRAKKAEEEAAGNIQLLRVAPRGTQYGGESPDYPLPLRNPQFSRSMEVLNGDLGSPVIVPLAEVPVGKKKKKKSSTLRRAQSLADGIAGESSLERYQRQRMHDAPVYYETAPMYIIDERRNGDLHVHPSTRPRYLVAAVPPHHSLEPAYLHGSVPSTPVLYQPHHHQLQNHHQRQHQQVVTSPTTPPHAGGGSPRAARYRNVHVIPRPEHLGTKSAERQPRPVSQFYLPPSSSNGGNMRPTSTPLRTPSPARSPSPAIYNTGPRKGKGKAIRVVEGWDEPEDETPRVIQSHEVGVAPKSKIMDEFNSRNTSSPFSITITNNKYASSSVTPSSNSNGVRLREPSRKNKARPVSAAPWLTAERELEQGEPVLRQNGHTTVGY